MLCQCRVPINNGKTRCCLEHASYLLQQWGLPGLRTACRHHASAYEVKTSGKLACFHVGHWLLEHLELEAPPGALVGLLALQDLDQAQEYLRAHRVIMALLSSSREGA